MAHHDTELLSAEISDRLKKSRHRQLIVDCGEKYAREKKLDTLSRHSWLSANRKFHDALSIGVLKTIILPWYSMAALFRAKSFEDQLYSFKKRVVQIVERSVERVTICGMNSLSKIRGKIRLSDLLEERCLFWKGLMMRI